MSAPAELDPEIAQVLAGMLAAPGPPPHELPVAQARVQHVEETAELCGSGEPVAVERDLLVRRAGHAGQAAAQVSRRALGELAAVLMDALE